MLITRRQMLAATGVAAASFAIGRAVTAADQPKTGFTLPPLPYAVDALEPSIDAKTMEIHHDRHHKAYVDNLNKALEGKADLMMMPIEEILRNTDKLPMEIRQAVINNGGGHANHTLFWTVMAPEGKGGGGMPKGDLAKAIDGAFGGYEKLQTEMNQAAATRFGSGWAWLVLDKGKLKVISTANQDSPLMQGMTPILGLDVWEHAYYLKYQNKRPDYVKAWWNVVNWDNVAERFKTAAK